MNPQDKKEKQLSTIESEPIIQALTQDALFSFQFDLTAGLIQQEIIGRNCFNYSAFLGLRAPFFYNEIVLRCASSGIKSYYRGKIISFTQDFLLNCFSQGTQNLNVVLRNPITDTSLSIQFLLTENHTTGHVEALVIGRAISDVIYQSTLSKKHELLFYHSVMKTLGEDYSTLFYVNVKKNAIHIEKMENESDLRRFIGSRNKEFTYGEILNQYIDYFVVEEEKADVRSRFRLESLAKQISSKKSLSFRYTCHNEKDKRFVVESHLVPIEDNLDCLIVGLRNVQDEVQSEKDRQRALTEALMVAERANSTKTRFFSDLSHNLRTPMNTIMGFTELAKNHIDNKTLIGDYLNKITLSSNRMLSLLDNILDMSQLESNQIKIEEKETSLLDLIHELQSSIFHSIESKHQELIFNTNGVIHERIYADKFRLLQILIQLLSNANQFTPHYGTIILTINEKTTSANRSEFEFSVKDNGIGMEENFLNHLFDPFAQVDTNSNKPNGSGLGLPIVKSLVSKMNGTISVKSKLNIGSEFLITLPFRIKPEHGSDDHLHLFKGTRALVIAPEFKDCLNLCNLLRECDLMAEWVTTLTEAKSRLHFVSQKQTFFPLVLLDDQPKDKDVFASIRQLRSFLPKESSLLLLTANDNAEFEFRAEEAGVNYFCPKPVFLSTLKECLSKTFQKEEPSQTIDYQYPGKEVLVVEDNLLNQEIAAEILKEAGITVAVADDGQAALDQVKSGHHFDLILMDVLMPKMDGYEATRQIRLLPNPTIANTPIIAMTANAFDSDKLLAKEAGMDDFIAKPIQLESFFQTLSKFLTRK